MSPSSSTSRCRQGVLQLPGHAFASLDKLRSHVREVLRSASLQSAASAALDDMQVKREI